MSAMKCWFEVYEDMRGKRAVFLNGTAICTEQKELLRWFQGAGVLSALCKLPVNILKWGF